MKNSLVKKIMIPFASVLFALPFNSCKKDEICDNSSLPCQTHEGKNTFGCLIDGVPFVAKTSFSIGGAVPLSGAFDETTKLLQIQGSREDANENLDDIRFRGYITQGVGTYVMAVTGTNYQGYVDYSGVNCIYYHNPDNKGSISITHIDTEENMISGTFFMTLVNSDCTKETLTITEGRFDFGY